MNRYPLIVGLTIENGSGQILLVRPTGRGMKYTLPEAEVTYPQRLTQAALGLARDLIGSDVYSVEPVGHYLGDGEVFVEMHVIYHMKLALDPTLAVRTSPTQRYCWFAKEAIMGDKAIHHRVREQFGEIPHDDPWFPNAERKGGLASDGR